MADRRSPNSPPILHLEQVTKQFPLAAAPAVASLTLTLQPGDLLALLGPSGCGKTTLLRLIAGFESPEQGRIEIAQQPVAGPHTWMPPEKRGVGMVFQDYALFPHLTVSENVGFGLSASQKPRGGVRQRVQEAIALVGLKGMEQRYPHQLSGGQQQRVALARALAPHPFLILLDEPLSNLDVQVRLRLRQDLREILKAAGTSAIFVTHDQEEALSIADRVTVLRSGRIEQSGPPEQLYQEPASSFVAAFVSQANLLPAQRSGQLWQTEIGSFPVQQVEVITSSDGDTATQGELMIRQECLSLQPDTRSGITIRDRQFLGREYRYCLQTPAGQELIARTAASDRWPVGAPVRVEVMNPDAGLRLFVSPA